MDTFDDELERGLHQRRLVLGDAWVDRSLAQANSFSADFQSLITRFAWQGVWGRPGLDPKTRRIVVIAITAAMGRWEECEMHLRAALQARDLGPEHAGLTPDDIKELLLETALYAGLPAANTAMALTQRVLRELGIEPAPATVAQAAHPGVGQAGRSAGPPALHYTVREPRSGWPPRHTLVLSHALGCDLSSWDALANAWAGEHRVVCYDHRGHGRSEAPAGPYTMAELADDANTLLTELRQRLDTGPVVWIGTSMGGMVGQELALRWPAALKALVIANASSGYPPEARAGWLQRIAGVEQGGIESIADSVLQRWFTPAFHSAQPAAVARWRRRLVSTPAAGYAGACHAVMYVDTTDRLGALALPTLVIAGAQDEATPPAMSRTLAAKLPQARLALVEGAAHLGMLEQGARYAALVQDFLAEL